MNKLLTVLVLLSLSVRSVAAQGSNVAGKWKAEFDTPIGMQKYLFTLEQVGATLKGAANADVTGQKHALQDGRVAKPCPGRISRPGAPRRAARRALEQFA